MGLKTHREDIVQAVVLRVTSYNKVTQDNTGMS